MNLEALKRQYETWERERTIREREHKIKLARMKVEYWTGAELKARSDSPNSYGLISTFKHKRKQAQSDLQYLLVQSF